jgi:transposase
MAQTKAEAKETAQILFFQGLTQKAIAKSLNVSENTISRWVKEGNWKNKKESLIISKEKRLSELYEELAEINRKIQDKEGYKVADTKDANVRRQLIKDIKDLETDYNVGEMVTIGRDFTNFVKEVDFDLAMAIIDVYDAFINHQLERKKWQK